MFIVLCFSGVTTLGSAGFENDIGATIDRYWISRPMNQEELEVNSDKYRMTFYRYKSWMDLIEDVSEEIAELIRARKEENACRFAERMKNWKPEEIPLDEIDFQLPY